MYGVEVFDWHFQSLDLNPIDLVWAYMKKELRGKNFKNKDELKSELDRLWDNILQEFIDKLIKSIPKRIKGELESNERNTKY